MAKPRQRRQRVGTIAQRHARGKAHKKFRRGKFSALIEKDLHQIVDAGYRVPPCCQARSCSQHICELVGPVRRWRAVVRGSWDFARDDRRRFAPQRRDPNAAMFQRRRSRIETRHRIEKMFDANIGGAIGQGDIVSVIAAGQHRFIDQDGTRAVAAPIAALELRAIRRTPKARPARRPSSATFEDRDPRPCKPLRRLPSTMPP